ncbi:hypothetical protein B0T21DRAFT_346271 [Apiosordaria backusii]|uniref:Uncharacterized protein n=1 Tax=Apiosordaria backusii TaxID=314023 RepID=A0AA40ENB9_9PEZI|nr:hypothetical protein B0T21DRAFT_346271 [Apiosordaria backusii]
MASKRARSVSPAQSLSDPKRRRVICNSLPDSQNKTSTADKQQNCSSSGTQTSGPQTIISTIHSEQNHNEEQGLTVNNDIPEYDHLIGCGCGPICESRLRALAITIMTHQARHEPNGTSIRPPAFYQRTREFSTRPIMWKKDWESGRIRPRNKMDDMLDN